MHHIDQSAADILKAAMKAERAAAEALERFIAHMPEEPAPEPADQREAEGLARERCTCEFCERRKAAPHAEDPKAVEAALKASLPRVYPAGLTDTEDAEAAYDAIRDELKRAWDPIPVLRPAPEDDKEGNPGELEAAVRAYSRLLDTLGMGVERLERRLRPILREDAAAIGHTGDLPKGASPMAQAVQAQNELLLGLIERLQTLEGALDV